MKNLLLSLVFLFPLLISAQNVGINNDGSAPNAGAILDIKSINKGILIPRTETSAIISPVDGMLIFQSSDKQFYFYKNGSWVSLGGGTTSGEFTSSGDLIYNAGSLEAQDFIFGRSVRPAFSNITDKFIYYEQGTGAFRGGQVNNSQVWSPINIGDNSFAYGKNVSVKGDNSHSLGVQNVVTGSSAFAFGVRDTVQGAVGSGVIGVENFSGGLEGSIAIGKGNRNLIGANEGSVTIGKGNIIGPDADEGAIAIGFENTHGLGYGSITMGYKNASLADSGAVTIGKGLTNGYENAVVLGQYNAYSNYFIEPVFSIGKGTSPYDFNNPRHDAFAVLKNGYTGINWNYPSDMLTVANVGDFDREGILIKGDTINNKHVHLIIDNNGSNGRGWGLVSTGNNAALGDGKFIIRDLKENREALTIDSFLNVGIRTSNPNDDLVVQTMANDDFAGVTVLGNNGVGEVHLILDNTEGGGSRFTLASTGINAIDGEKHFLIRNGATGDDHFSINPNGNVGINMVDASEKLTINADAADASGILIQGGTSTNRPMLRIKNNGIGGREYELFSSGQNAGIGRGKFSIRDKLSGLNRFVIDSVGNTGLGIFLPRERLDIDGALIVGEAENINSGTIQFKNNEFRGYNGTEWVPFDGSKIDTISIIKDADGDTSIDVEEANDGDKIHFKLDGLDQLVISNTNNLQTKFDILNTDGNIIFGNGNTALTTNSNVMIGIDIAMNTETSSKNVYIGEKVSKTGSGFARIGIGLNALSNATGGNLVALGQNSLTTMPQSNAIGIGVAAGEFATETGIYIGQQSGRTNDGEYCTFIGQESGENNENGNYNAFYGYRSGQQFQTGGGNTLIGAEAGQEVGAVVGLTGGSNNTLIGYRATSTGSYSSSIALGSLSAITASNQIRLGVTTTASIGGYQNWTNISDGRFKTQVKEDVPGLSFIQKLRPVSYHLDVDAINQFIGISLENSKGQSDAKTNSENQLQTGFIAQEVERAASELGYSFSGVDAPKNETDHYGLRYAEFVVPIVKAMQEQQVMIDKQQEQIQLLIQTVENLKKQIEK